MGSGPLKSRRDFLKTGASGLAGAAMLASGACSPKSEEDSPGGRTFIYRTLGRTGLKLPVVNMGSDYAINLVRTALDEGIVYVHTSSGYSGGNHERLMGKVFQGMPRDSFVVATNPDLPYRMERGGSRSMDVGTEVDPKLITESIEGSLERLGLDYVDISFTASSAGGALPQCPAKMDIPTLMRGYMYAFGYRQLKKARETLRAWTRAEVTCRSCPMCDVNGSLGFDVRSRALDVASILEVSEEFLV